MALPFKPAFQYKATKEIQNNEVTTFTAYDYSIIEERTIIKILKNYLRIDLSGQEDDLWKVVKDPFVEIKNSIRSFYIF